MKSKNHTCWGGLFALVWIFLWHPLSLAAATVTWVGGSGDWNDTNNWSTGALPGTSDNVVIDSGPSITVTHSSGTHTVNSIQTSEAFVLSGGQLTVTTTFQASNTITLSGGTLQTATVTTSGGASLIVNGSPTLDGVTVNGVLDVGNTYNGVQLMVLDGLVLHGTALVGNPTNGDYGYLSFSGTQTLGGNGTVVFGNSGNNTLYLASSGTTLTLGPGITVEGQNGNIGNGTGSVVNQGTISADVANGTITINAQPFTNQGLVESPAGALSVNLWENSGQTIVVGTNTGSLNLSGGTIHGGTITISNGVSLVVSGSPTLDGVTVNGVLDVGNSYNGAHLTVLDGLVLDGTVLVGNPTNGWYGQMVFSGSQSLTGNGTVVFGDSGNNYVYPADSGTTLTLGPGITVEGQYGNIGNDTGSVVNQGTISADVSGGSITINAQPFTNLGLIESPAGTLSLAGTLSTAGLGNFQSGSGPLALSGVLTNTGQTLVLNGLSNLLTLQGGTIIGGSVNPTNGASFIVSSGTLDGVTVNGVLDVGNSYNGAHLTVLDGLVLDGTVLVGNPTNGWYGQMVFSGSQSLTGNGTVVFGDSGNNYVYPADSGTTLTLGPGITVEGQYGNIGNDTGSVVNQGTISADVSGGSITINAEPFTNLGLIESPAGTLSLAGTLSTAGLGNFQSGSGPLALSGVLTNTGQTLVLNGLSNLLTLQGGTIIGGSVNPTNGASFIVSSGTLDGVTVNGVLDVGNSYNGAHLTVLDGLVLDGTVLVGNPTNGWYGQMVFSGSQSLTGNGTVVFGDSGNNYVYPADSGTTLTLGPGITVEGQYGNIGNDTGSVVNQGTISADVSGGSITINAEPFTNLGLIESPAGTLSLAGTLSTAGLGNFQSGSGPLALSGVLTNTGQTLVLNGLSNLLTLQGGTIIGGSVNPTNGASFIVSSGTLDGVTVNGVLDVGNSYNGAHLTVLDGLVLDGTVLVGNPTNGWYGQMVFSGSQSLTGNGTVVFGDSGNNYVYPADSGTTLTLGPGITVEGQYGNIGNDTGSVVNQGTISADVSGGSITINAEQLSNVGTLSAPIGTLSLNGTYNLAGGVIDVGIGGLSSFGQINFSGDVSFAGAFGISLNNGYQPALGNSFALINYGSENGSFNSYNIPNTGLPLQVNYGNSSVTVTAVQQLVPIVNIISPTNNSIYQTPVNITINATAASLAGTISKVDFFQGTNQLGEALASPCSVTWSNVPPGAYSIIATATDSTGAVGVSSAKIVTVLPTTQGTNFTWVGSVSSDWFTAGNWSPVGVPGALDEASILNGGTVSVSQNAAIGFVNLASGTINGAGLLSVSNIFYWTGGSVFCPVTIQTNSVMIMAGSSTLNLFGVLTNAGTVDWAGTGNLVVYNDNGGNGYTGGIVNLAGAVFNAQNDQNILCACYGYEYFNNAGLFQKGLTTGTTTIGVAFTNTGTVDVQSGTVDFNGSGNVGGTYITAANTGLGFGGNNSGTAYIGAVQDLSVSGGAVVALNGTVQNLSVSGGTLTFNGPVQNLAASGGTFNGVNSSISNVTWNGGTLGGSDTITGSASWTGGAIGAGGAVTVSSNVVLNISGSSTLNLFGVLTNAGTVDWAGTGNLVVYNDNGGNGYTGGIVNLAGAVFNAQNDQNILCACYGYEYFNNAGLFQKGLTTGTTTIGVAFTNTGTVDVQSGTVDFNGSGNVGGTYITAANTGLGFGGNNSGTAYIGAVQDLSVSGGAVVALNGTVQNLSVSGGTLTFNGPVQNLAASGGTFNGVNSSISNVTWNGGTLGGSDTITGSASWTGGAIGAGGAVTVSSNVVLNISGSSTLNLFGVLTNAGTVDWAGTGNLVVYNDNGGNGYTGGIVNLAGAVFNAQNDQNILCACYGYEYFNNAGLFQKGLTTGTTTIGVAFTNTGTVDVQSGTVSFSGAYDGANGTLDFAINSANNYGQITFGSAFAMTGTLGAQLSGGYLPSDGNAFTLLTYPSRSGTFGAVNVPTEAVWEVSNNPTAFIITASTVCTPPPSGIVAWWPGDENANDIQGTNNGTLVGGVTFTNGEVGQAFSFDGVDGEVSMPLQPVSDLLSPTFTIEFWASSVAGGEPTFGFVGSDALNTDYPLISYNSWLSIGNGAGGYQLLPRLPDAPSASWAHYAIVCDGTNYSEYFDGVVINSQPIAVLPASASSRQFVIGESGACCGYQDPFNGFIDEFTIYNRGLTSNEIAAIYTAGAGGKCKAGLLPPNILAQPANQLVPLGGTAEFSVSANGTAPLFFQWFFDQTNVISGQTNSTLILNSISNNSAGYYSVVVTNAYGSAISAPATLTILRDTPTITWTNPNTVPYGTVLGPSQLDATVSFASTNVPGNFVYNPTNGSVPSAGTDTLSVVFTPADTNDYNGVTDSVSLVVQPAPLTVTAANASRVYGQANPVFTGTMIGLTNGDNITATYSCSATPLSPPGAYQIVPSLVDPGNRLGNYIVTASDGTLTVTAGPPPTLTGIAPNKGYTNGGTVVIITGSGFELGAAVSFGGQAATSVAVNSETQITAVTPPGPLGLVNVVMTNPDSTSAALINGFIYTGPPPSIVTQPVSLSVVRGSNAVFQVSALYAGGYQWQFNGGNLTDNGRITGSHGNLLTIPGVQPTDAGNYQVIITNVYGSTSSSGAGLTVVVPPTITSSPQAQSVGVGGTAMFTVGVSGSAPFSYQWLKGSSPLSNATSSVLSLANVQSTNQGQYSVVVGNAAGSTSSVPALLTVLNYCASARPSQPVYAMGSPVPLTVQTLNCSSQTPVPNSIATVWISTGGVTRSLSVNTGPLGTATVNFAPLATETGIYQVAATLPGQSIPAPQGTFALVGMGLSTSGLSVQLTPGITITNTITLSNLTSVDLTGVTAGIVGETPDVQVQLSTPATLTGNSTIQLTYVLTAPSDTVAQDQFDIQLTTAQGTTNTVPVTANVVPSVPQLAANPASLFATMVGGGQKLVNFTVANIGGATSGPVQVLLPSAPWLTLVTPQPIPPLAPGRSSLVTLALTPPTNLALGVYSGGLELTSSNAQLAVPFQFDCVSILTGSLSVTVQDELSIYGEGNPNVSNATVTVVDFLTGTTLATNVTDASGTVLFSNLTSAYYTVSVTAPDHNPYSSTLLLTANETNALVAFLNLQLVDYTWVVTPTTVPDQYTFTLDTTFATQVPWPVVTVNPGAIDLCTIQGQTNQINLTITNSGLISAQGLTLYFGSHPDWSIQPLVTSLGDLLPQTNMVVPVTITRLGSTTGVPDSITAQLSYHVAAVNTTNYTIVPIYVIDANPADCGPQSAPPQPTNNVCASCGGGSGPTGGGPTLSIPSPSYSPQTPALVEVKLQINQSAVIARDAFNASLQLVNNAGAAVSNLCVTITVYDGSNNVANSLFGIPAPALNGLNAVDGTGALADNASGTASWTIVPATNAAPQVATQFKVGGSFSYILNGEPVIVPLFPVPITVQPTPIFTVDYFLQHDVYSDDPFTPQIEPSIPFALGILVRNIGYGNAYDFSITSAQPQIIQNSNDLLIAFSLIGSQIGSNSAISPSFTLDFGDLGPQTDASGLWYMTSTLEGEFISFAASYQHVDDFGNTNTSLINSVNIHEMNHVVRITVPTDDGLPDFLVNDTTNVDALPDIVYSSDGSTDPVTSITDGVTTGVPSSINSNITLTVSAPVGWVYLEVADPGNGTYPIINVRRSDGVNLLVGPNVWQTPVRVHMVPPKTNNLIHVFDYNSTGSYTITYGLPIIAPTATTLAATDVDATNAALNALVDPNGADTEVYFQWGTTTNYGNFTPSTTLTGDLYTSQNVALAIGGLQEHTTYHYQAVAINSAGTNFGEDATLVTSNFPPPVITQVTNRSAIVGQNISVTNHAIAATLPVTWSLGGSVPAGATINSNGIFTWTPACEEGSSTNEITVWATDSSSPPLSNYTTFDIAVSECVQVGVGSTVMQVGTTSSVPVMLLSSVGITNLSFNFASPANRFTNWTFVSSNASIATTNVQTMGSSPPLFTLGTQPGQTLQSNSVLGSIGFTALPGASAFVPVVATNIIGFKSDGSGVGNISGLPGQVIVIGLQPILQAGLGTNPPRLLTIYGNPGSNYPMTFSTNLVFPNWQSAGSVLMTNLQQNFNVNQTAPQIYYRAQ